jgi:hypothetical protein
VKNGTKTGILGAPVPTEVPCFHNHLAGAQKTAKPLCVGSIPTRASIHIQSCVQKETEASCGWPPFLE